MKRVMSIELFEVCLRAESVVERFLFRSGISLGAAAASVLF